MWWKITVVVGHSVRAPTLRRDFTCWCWRAASLLAVSVCPGTPAATPPGSCRTTGRISHTEASDLPPSLRGHDQGNGALLGGGADVAVYLYEGAGEELADRAMAVAAEAAGTDTAPEA